MQAEIINIGDELLIGQTVNTNASWLGERLNQHGFRVNRTVVVPDQREAILESLQESLERSHLVLITGGLGPTKDDITKKTLCEFFGTDLVIDEESLRRVESFFASRGMTMLNVNRLQAEVPRSCKVIPNLRGTANGMWFERDGKVVVSMPGVPHELHAMVDEAVIPRALAYFERPPIVHRTILTAGVGESYLADRIAAWEDSLGAEQIKLAYLPSPGLVKLRMSSYSGHSREEVVGRIARKEKELMALIGDIVFGFDQDTLGSVVGRLLSDRHATLCVAESCTGGYLSHLVTSVPGASEYFAGGVVAYTYSIKDHQLGVSGELLASEGAVNEETAIQMARGARERLQTTYAISTTGIAGPAGGTEENPVGTVWIGIAGPDRVFARQFRYGKSRERTILMASQAGLDLLRKEILGIAAAG
ncbi:MAG: competence/damage-inducible protein A [Flavobacteriales bacterium]|jgi:nicotinamide-nucleotide amidase